MDVSIIIPTYNRLWCLPRAIDSCLNTTCKTEIIVVDDGSTDGTWEWLQQKKNITSIYQSNKGQVYAINTGVAKASGKYIRFLDSDDFLYEGIIDKQFLKAEMSAADLVYSRVDGYDEQKGIITVHPNIDPWDDFIEVQLSNRYGSHFLGMLFKTHLVNQVPRRPDFAFREDRMFLLEYALLNPVIDFFDEPAGCWVSHSGQMQANYLGWKAQVTNWQHLNIFKEILYRLELRTELTTARKKAACTVLWPLAHWIAKDFLNEAEAVIKWIYKLDPDFKIPDEGTVSKLYKYMGFVKTEKILRLRRFIKRGWK